MKFQLTLDCDNAAFADNELMYAVAETLTETAKRVEAFQCGADRPLAIFDANGNRIGEAYFLIDPER